MLLGCSVGLWIACNNAGGYPIHVDIQNRHSDNSPTRRPCKYEWGAVLALLPEKDEYWGIPSASPVRTRLQNTASFRVVRCQWAAAMSKRRLEFSRQTMIGRSEGYLL